MISTVVACVALCMGSVHGVIRSAADSRPVAGVLVTVVGGQQSALSGADGRYALEALQRGAQTILVQRAGYRPLTLTALVGDDVVKLDITVTPDSTPAHPVRIPAVHIVTAAPTIGPALAAGNGATRLDAWRVSGTSLRRPGSLAQSDPLRALRATPAVAMAAESPTALHVRGGASDQNLVLLDGIPLVNAKHAGELLSAVDGATLASVTLEGGAPSARYGGRLSGVVNIRTSPPKAHPWARASVSPAATGAILGLPVAGHRGGILVSARRGHSGLGTPVGLSETGEGARLNSWSDVLGVASAGVGGDSLAVIALASHDAVGFDAVVPSPAAQSVDGSASEASSLPDEAQPTNVLHWRSLATGVSWSHAAGSGTIRSTLWRSQSNVAVGWYAAARRADVASAVVHDGASVDVAWGASAATRAGFALERMHPRMITTRVRTPAAADRTQGAPRVTLLDGRLQLASLYAERAWSVGRLHASVGVRGTAANAGDAADVREASASVRRPREGRGERRTSGSGVLLEPRASLQFSLSPALEVGAGYARTHQYEQSAWNEESPVQSLVGVDVLTPAGAGGLPIASADGVTVSALMRPSATSRITLDAYGRQLRGVATPAVAGAAPFADGALPVGQERAAGLGIAADQRIGPVVLEASWAVSRVRRIAGKTSYQPSSAPSQRYSAAVTDRLGAHTALRFAAEGEAGRRGTLIAGPLLWTWGNGYGPHHSISGAPEAYAGPLGSARLPNYFRVDVGLQHDLRVGFPWPGVVSTFVDVENVLGRFNALAVVRAAGGTVAPIPMRPRSVIAGASWTF